MHKKIRVHLKKVDPKLYAVLERVKSVDGIKMRDPKDYFSDLCREIIGQQLAGKAKAAIVSRFLALLPEKKVTPRNILRLSREELRGVGMSWAKADYIRDLAQKVFKKEVSLDRLDTMDNISVMQELRKIKGIGNWTAEMFLMFSLGREDVFSFGDLGLRKAIQRIYRISEVNKEQAEKISLRWSPYRTWACLILWAFVDS